jgi:hypothetical protein
VTPGETLDYLTDKFRRNKQLRRSEVAWLLEHANKVRARIKREAAGSGIAVNWWQLDE